MNKPLDKCCDFGPCSKYPACDCPTLKPLDEPPVLGAGVLGTGGGISPVPPRMSLWFYDIGFRWKRLRVCLLCYWYLRHWPMNDLSETEWLFQLDGETARSAFIEGWCRD